MDRLLAAHIGHSLSLDGEIAENDIMTWTATPLHGASQL